jgi:hypothetical protein
MTTANITASAESAYLRDHPQHAAGIALLREHGITGQLLDRAETQRAEYVAAFVQAERDGATICEMMDA